ncbi:MAG: hypothetical protein EBT57_10545, partial [Verrucomicrobia bacterium]|nr:hypothetical protein [Verrucomicrobiota bacterium]
MRTLLGSLLLASGGLKRIFADRRFLFFLISVFGLATAQAQTTNSYTNTTNSLFWATAANWSLGSVPLSTSEVYVTNGVEVRIGSAAVASNLFIGGSIAGSNSIVALRRDAGSSLTVGGNITMGSGAGNAYLRLGVGGGNTNPLTIGGGTGSILDGGGAGTTSIEVYGPVTLNLATVTVDNLNINQNSAGSMTIGTGQTWNVTTTRIGELHSNLAYDLTVAGTLNSTTINLSPAVSAGTNSGTLNLNSGGLIRATTLQRTGTMSSAFNWNDGTIQNSSGANLAVQGSTTNILTMRLAGTGTHTFNADSGRTITVASTATLADKSGEQGTLAKAGAGELIFQGTNTYTGLTTINAGTLTLSS